MIKRRSWKKNNRKNSLQISHYDRAWAACTSLGLIGKKKTQFILICFTCELGDKDEETSVLVQDLTTLTSTWETDQREDLTVPRWNRRGISKWHITIFLMAFQSSWERKGLERFINYFCGVYKTPPSCLELETMKCCYFWTRILPKKEWNPSYFRGVGAWISGWYCVLCSECCLWPLEEISQELGGKWHSQLDRAPHFPHWAVHALYKVHKEVPAELIWGSQREMGKENLNLLL